MKRVLHVPTVPWQTTEAIARACHEIAGARGDVDAHVITDLHPADDAALTFHTVPGGRARVPWTREFRKVMTEVRPDVVHLHGGTLAPLLAYAPVLRGTPVVATCYRSARIDSAARGAGERRANTSTLRGLATTGGGMFLARRALRAGRVGAICSPDMHIVDAFSQWGPVVPATGAATLRTESASWSEEPVVVFAGRAQHARGIDDLLHVFPRVRDEIPGARLRLALLPAPDANAYQTRFANVPWVDVTVGATDLPEVYGGAQLAVFPFHFSLTLTPALTAAEAMAAGLPVVAADVDCLRALVEPGVNGLLVRPGSESELAAAIVTLLRDPETWQPHSEGARKTIEERWSWSDAADATFEAYEIAQRRAA